MNKVIMVMAISALALTGCKGNIGKGEPGYELMKSRCGRCHPTGVKKAHATKEEWEQTVSNMMVRGATLNPAEKATLVDFLVKYYHP